MRVFVEPWVQDEIKRLPGHVRQRVRRAIQALGDEPRPTKSRVLSVPDEIEWMPGLEARRLRLDPWRILYVVDEPWQAVVILAVRRRPPYDYEDLGDLLAQVE